MFTLGNDTEFCSICLDIGQFTEEAGVYILMKTMLFYSVTTLALLLLL